MKFSTLLSPQLMHLNHQAKTVDEVLSVAAATLASACGKDAAVIKTMLLHRERLGSTYIDKGLMVPHAYLEELHDCLILFLHAPEGVPVPNSSNRAYYFFVILTTKEYASLYLNILRVISEIVTSHEEILKSSGTTAEFIAKIDATGLRVEKSLRARDLVSAPVAIPDTASLSDVVDIMKERNLTQLPVVNAQQEFVGIVDFLDILTTSMPEYILRLHNVSFIEDFEPISHFLEHEKVVEVKRFLRFDKTMVIQEDTSYMEVFYLMAKYKHKLLVITNEKLHLTGVIRTSDIINKAFRA